MSPNEELLNACNKALIHLLKNNLFKSEEGEALCDLLADVIDKHTVKRGGTVEVG